MILTSSFSIRIPKQDKTRRMVRDSSWIVGNNGHMALIFSIKPLQHIRKQLQSFALSLTLYDSLGFNFVFAFLKITL